MEEKVSLSDRFGLWLGFHKCSQDEYLREWSPGYAAHLGLACDEDTLRHDALEWGPPPAAPAPACTAWQFIQDLAGRLGKRIDGRG